MIELVPWGFPLWVLVFLRERHFALWNSNWSGLIFVLGIFPFCMAIVREVKWWVFVVWCSVISHDAYSVIEDLPNLCC